MKKILLLLLIVFITRVNAQTCGTGGCTAADTNSTGRYPASTFSTVYSSWSTVSAYMNAGNYTLFNVTSGDTYEWTYCSDFGGSQGWDAELTLFNKSSGATLCYQNNCARSGCSTAPYIRWTATFTGIVKLLTTVSGCATNTGAPYSKLVWRDTSGTLPVQILGVDVYSGNSTIDWNQVKAAGYTFAYAKATEGVGYTDSKYLNYAVNGVTAGMKMGAYHFARPDLNPTNAGAIAEANYFLSVAQPYIISCQLPPSLDLEGSYLTTSFTSAQLTAWVQNWMNTVQAATGIKPVLYIGASTVSYLNSSLNIYPLWRDELTSSPSPATNLGVWTTWAFNQYSWTGTVPGIAGSTTDLNFFNGNVVAFNNFMGCTVTNIKENNLNIDLVIYPNPSTGIFQVKIDRSETMDFEVYNTLGENIYSTKINEGSAEINLSEASKGVYFYQLKRSTSILKTGKIIIE
jgi:GH25 family lysozyme M1 (1,4-beta-N-acetylmuramidase)